MTVDFEVLGSNLTAQVVCQPLFIWKVKYVFNFNYSLFSFACKDFLNNVICFTFKFIDRNHLRIGWSLPNFV